MVQEYSATGSVSGKLSGKLAKCFWDRHATLINHKVRYEERMAQKQPRLENIGLEVGERISLQEQRKEDRKKKKQEKREEEKMSKKKKQPSTTEPS